jgi:erythronate-4-phosphate dehydrogenase
MNDRPLKIVADENMPLVKELFSPYGDVRLIPGRSIRSEDVLDADVLLVRSVTSVNSKLLQGSSVKFVGSATIGIDHVDTTFLSSSGIRFAFAPGCNAKAVVQYDLSVMSRLMPDWQDKTVGIIGCGNVGGQLCNTLSAIGVNCRVYDPFLPADGRFPVGNLNEVLGRDIVCVHTPLTYEGLFPTHHMIDRAAINRLGAGALLINAGRGEVIDTEALLDILRSGKELSVALDVWESEPDICSDLLRHVSLGTPHIAGYSLEGKVNGTTMVFDRFLEWLNVQEDYTTRLSIDPVSIIDQTINSFTQALLASYDVLDDDKRMRERLFGLAKGSTEQRDMFDALRREYPVRREFGSTVIDVGGQTEGAELKSTLAAVGFLLTEE